MPKLVADMPEYEFTTPITVVLPYVQTYTPITVIQVVKSTFENMDDFETYKSLLASNVVVTHTAWGSQIGKVYREFVFEHGKLSPDSVEVFAGKKKEPLPDMAKEKVAKTPKSMGSYGKIKPMTMWQAYDEVAKSKTKAPKIAAMSKLCPCGQAEVLIERPCLLCGEVFTKKQALEVAAEIAAKLAEEKAEKNEAIAKEIPPTLSYDRKDAELALMDAIMKPSPILAYLKGNSAAPVLSPNLETPGQALNEELLQKAYEACTQPSPQELQEGQQVIERWKKYAMDTVYLHGHSPFVKLYFDEAKKAAPGADDDCPF